MNDGKALEIARSMALRAGRMGEHQYLPATDAAAATWEPHQWVVDAICEAGAKVGDAPLCEQIQALQARAAKLRPIDLQDAELNAADPYTKMFLLAEYWQRKAAGARTDVSALREAVQQALRLAECSGGPNTMPEVVATLRLALGPNV